MDERKMGIRGIGMLILLASSNLSAASISWQPYTAVPMGTTSLAILALLFMLGGSWILFRSRKYRQSFAVLAAALVGAYSFPAVAVLPVSIDTPEGTQSLSCDLNIVTNNSGQTVTITQIDTSGCPNNGGDCEINQPFADGDTCTILLRIEK